MQATENKSSSPNVINIDLDNDRTSVASSSSGVSAGSQHEQSQGGRIARNSGPLPPTSQAPPPSQSSQMRTKNITFGELTDTIIANDYGPNPMHLRAPHPANFMPYMQEPQGIVTPDRWKMNRRVQKEAEAAAASKGPPNSQSNVNSSSGPGTPTNAGGRSNTPGDDRNIIRMPQAVSPRKYMQEFMMHDYHFQQQQQQQHGAPPPGSSHSSAIMRQPPYDSGPGGPSGSSSSSGGPQVVQNHAFDTMKYVQNRIVEAMRTEDDHRAGGGVVGAGGPSVNDHDHHHNDHRMKDSHEPRKTPNQYDDRDGGRRSASSDSSHPSSLGGGGVSYQQTPVTTFAATTYAYPYSALNVPNSASGLPPPPQMSLNTAHQMQSSSGASAHKQPTHILHGGSVHDAGPNSTVSTTSGVGGGGGQGGAANEPKPLLSAQYEALSDED